MSLSKEESHELFLSLNDKGRLPQMSRGELQGLKEEMSSEIGSSFAKLAQMFKEVDELIVAKIFCQN